MTEAAGQTGLKGLTILVAEDEGLVSWMLEEILAEEECTVIGPASQLDKAIELSDEARLDGALLDVNLRGELVFPVAARLTARGIPVILLTGYDNPASFPEAFQALPCLSKPFDRARLVATMRRCFRAAV